MDTLRDYISVLPSVAAVINGFIAVMIAQFFKENKVAKVILVASAGVLGAAAIGADFYGRHQLMVAERVAAQHNKEIRTQLGDLIQEGTALIAGCSNASEAAPVAAVDAWLHKVTDFLDKKLDHSYSQRLINPVGSLVNVMCNSANAEYSKLFRIVMRVNAHLEQFSQQAAF
jgi:hypothetical protein